ncbi:MAG: glycosyltransferase [Rudaea sp.]|nr:glycosyltransferase [Rudaea sp.]
MDAAQDELLSVLILARNEAKNLDELLPHIAATLTRMSKPFEIIVVDADSPDGTAAVAARHRARVVPQQASGYANALRQGFSECTGGFILTLDADFSHRPDFFEELIRAGDGADIVVASRYVRGGSADMPVTRRLLSTILNRVFALVLGLQTRDLSSGFRIYRRSALQMLAPRGDYFDVLPEIVALACVQGLRIHEIPFHYHPREAGVSKARVVKFIPSYVRTLLRCWSTRRASSNTGRR